MINVNGKEFKFQEGMTVKRLLEVKKYVYPKIIVKVNGVVIPKNQYTDTQIKDRDDIQVIHLLGGG